ncbi:MAG: hypothetical protein AB1728_02245 [Bacteroidota bacterium]
MSSKKFTSLAVLIFLYSTIIHAQDTLTVLQSVRYSTIGFQASFVSGIGISFGINETGKYRARATFGVLTNDSKTYSSFGVDYQFELTKRQDFRVFIGPGFGVRSISTEDSHTALGLGTGVEAPATGNSIYQNVTGGVTIYYPTFFFLSKNISFAGAIFISYNF